MDAVRIRRRLAASPVAPLAALPVRVDRVLRHNASVARLSARWLVRSREHTNLTYELTDLNRDHLAWYVAGVAGVPVAQARGYLAELAADDALRRHVAAATAGSDRRGLADREVRYGRRAGWYALVRATRPAHVVETGTDKGLGACVLAAALLHNGSGRLTTIDVNPASGYLVRGPYAAVVDRRVADSVTTLRALTEPVDLFLHDSDHSPAYELAELEAVEHALAPGALVLSDNAHETRQLSGWAEARGMRFDYFAETAAGHPFPVGGIGAARAAGQRRVSTTR